MRFYHGSGKEVPLDLIDVRVPLEEAEITYQNRKVLAVLYKIRRTQEDEPTLGVYVPGYVTAMRTMKNGMRISDITPPAAEDENAIKEQLAAANPFKKADLKGVKIVFP